MGLWRLAGIVEVSADRTVPAGWLPDAEQALVRPQAEQNSHASPHVRPGRDRFDGRGIQVG